MILTMKRQGWITVTTNTFKTFWNALSHFALDKAYHVVIIILVLMWRLRFIVLLKSMQIIGNRAICSFPQQTNIVYPGLQKWVRQTRFLLLGRWHSNHQSKRTLIKVTTKIPPNITSIMKRLHLSSWHLPTSIVFTSPICITQHLVIQSLTGFWESVGEYGAKSRRKDFEDMADSCQCMAKPLQYCKLISLQLKF